MPGASRGNQHPRFVGLEAFAGGACGVLQQRSLDEQHDRLASALQQLGRSLPALRDGCLGGSVEQCAVGVDVVWLWSHCDPECGQREGCAQLGGGRELQAPPRRWVIQPWERNQVGPIEKAILKSDLGLAPTNDGASIRLSIPPLTEERRHDLVKLVRKRVESGRIAVRNIRRDAQEGIRALEKEKAISQDEMARARGKLQKITDASIDQSNTIGQEKEAEVLEV